MDDLVVTESSHIRGKFYYTGEKAMRRWSRERFEDAMKLSLAVEEGARSQGMQVLLAVEKN